MSDDNLMMTISEDPRLKAMLDKMLGLERFQVPDAYAEEIREIIAVKISIISNIDGPEDYRALQQANYRCRSCKDTLATMRSRLKELHFFWSDTHRKALKYIQTKYFSDLHSVKDSSSKAILAHAMEPFVSEIARIEYMQDQADLAKETLDEVNWAIKSSCDMVTKYYETMKMVAPSKVYGAREV